MHPIHINTHGSILICPYLNISSINMKCQTAILHMISIVWYINPLMLWPENIRKLGQYHGYHYLVLVSIERLFRLSGYIYSYYKDKTIVRQSCLYNRNSYIGKTAYFYWNNPQIPCISRASADMISVIRMVCSCLP